MHILSLLGTREKGSPSSEGMAGSIGVNPVIVRNVIGMLRRAGLVRTQRGVPGTYPARPLSEITLLDVYRAVETNGELFALHARPDPHCPVGGSIRTTLERVFGEARRAMEARLAGTSMAEVVQELRAGASSRAKDAGVSAPAGAPAEEWV